jgi:hypothetical protein
MDEGMKQAAVMGGAKRRPKGWTAERRTRQAALIRGWRPWRRSTGPKTEAGKARCSMNALKHGCTGRDYRHDTRRVRYALCLAEHNNRILRLYIRLRDLPRRGDYVLKAEALAMRLSAAIEGLRLFREKAAAKIFQKSNERTNENGNRPTPPISYERAAKRPHRFGRSRATSHGGRERTPVLPSPKIVGRRPVTPEPRGGEGGTRSPP